MFNNLKVVLLMALLTGILVGAGGLLGGMAGALLCFILALGLNFLGYWYSDKIAIRMAGAQPATEAEMPVLYEILRELTVKAGLPMPAVYLVPSNQPNAFATGRDERHAAVAVTEGLMRLLDREQLAGVLAHELAHIKNKDILIGAIAAALAGAVSMIANIAQWGLFFGGSRDDGESDGGGVFGVLLAVIVAPLAAMLIQMAVSRSREFQADATGAGIAGQPRGLAAALLKLEKGAQMLPMEVAPAAAHMFIINPLRGGGLASLFSTHPPIAERVRRLREMGS